MPPTIDTHHKHALQLVLAEIDSSPNTYDSKKKQFDLLGRILQQHDLKCHGNSSKEELDKLTVIKYYRKISTIASKHCNSLYGMQQKSIHIFMNGSSVIDRDYLDKIGYHQRARSATASSQTIQSVGKSAGDKDPTRLSEDPDVYENTTRSLISQQLAQEDISITRKASNTITSLTSLSDLDDFHVSAQHQQPHLHQDTDGMIAKKTTGDTKVLSEAVCDNRDISLLTSERRTSYAGVGGGIIQPPVLSAIRLTTPIEDEAQSTNRPYCAIDHRSGRQLHRNQGVQRLGETEASNTDHKRKLSSARQNVRSPKKTKHINDSAIDGRPRAFLDPTMSNGSGILDRATKLSLDPVPISTIQYHLDNMKLWSRSFAVSILKEASQDTDTIASLDLSPTKDLKTLYQIVFGHQYQRQAFLSSQTDPLLAFELLQSLMSAAWFKLLCLDDMPLSGPSQWAQPLREVEQYIDAVLKAYSTHRPMDIHTVFAQAFLSELQNTDNEESRIAHTADELAWTFMMIIEPQFQVLGISEGGMHSNEFWRKIGDIVSRIFSTALVLKGVLLSSPHHYEHRWITVGSAIEPQIMEQPYESNHPGMVKFCLCPAMWLKETEDSERIMVCKADIIPASRTRPM